MTYEFTLIVDGADLQSDASVDALLAAGCDDALVRRTDGVQHVDFSREAASLEAAVAGAVREIESVAGARVVRIADAGLVSMADIAERTGRTRESVRLLVAGDRGPQGFPAPVTSPTARYRLWRWSDVRRWFAEALGQEIDSPAGHVLEALNAGLEMRYHLGFLDDDRARKVRELAGPWQSEARGEKRRERRR